MINPYQSNDISVPVDFSYPKQHDNSWTSMSLGDFYANRQNLDVVIPCLAKSNKRPLLNFGLG